MAPPPVAFRKMNVSLSRCFLVREDAFIAVKPDRWHAGGQLEPADAIVLQRKPQFISTARLPISVRAVSGGAIPV